MIDTHTHLYMADSFPDGGAAAVDRAVECGVDMMILPNVDRASATPLLELHRLRPGVTRVAPGIHPTEIAAGWRDDLRGILDLFSGTQPVAIGEVGVDLHWGSDNLILQMDAFGEQLELAHTMNLPVIIHSRDALKETLEVVRSMGSHLPPLLFHSFTASPREAGNILDLTEAMFAFNGVITFKNAGEVREAARFVGLDRIMLETDSPFLAPVPMRGRTNESSLLPHVLDGVSAALDLGRSEVETATDRNARSFFRLAQST